MCGIAGVMSKTSTPVTKLDGLVNTLNDRLVHRGPDGGAVWVNKTQTIGLGHRRLAILDLASEANQPMTNEDGSIWITFNGEIYNHAEIRKLLLKRGHQFRTDHSDTEVIIHAYEEWGVASLERFRGMFVFALWDESLNKLWLVRDRLGIKPLYYTSTNTELVFASEIQALFSHPRVKKEVRTQSVYDYLTLLTVPAPHTMFEEIYKLEAGTYLTITSGDNLVITRYWNPTDYLNSVSDTNESTALKETTKLIQESVALRMLSDVPVGVSLSGGIDSSLVAAYASKNSKTIKALTVDYQQRSAYSESEAAAEIAQGLGIPLTKEIVTEEAFNDAVSSMLEQQNDYPMGDPNTFLVKIIAAASRKLGAIVCLIGEGGDELGGYPVYQTIDREYGTLKALAKLPKPLRLTASKYGPAIVRRKLELIHNSEIVSRRHLHAFMESEKQQFWKNPKDVISTYDYLQTIMGEVPNDAPDHFLRKIQNVEFKLRLPELILPRVDYPTMSHSIEARVPLLDHKLVEYTLRLPFALKMNNGEPKYLLKKIIANLIPHFSTKRPKVGFGMLLEPFLQESVPESLKTEVFADPKHPLFLYVKREELLKTLDLEHPASHGLRPWAIFILSRWLKCHLD